MLTKKSSLQEILDQYKILQKAIAQQPTKELLLQLHAYAMVVRTLYYKSYSSSKNSSHYVNDKKRYIKWNKEIQRIRTLLASYP